MIYLNPNIQKPILIGFFSLIIVILRSQLCSASFLPNQLHSETEIYYQNSDKTKSFSWCQVNEYVDFARGRSSLQLLNIDDGSTSIFYNQLSAPGGSSKRKFMMYDVNKNTCKSTSIMNWPLKKIRKILISMLPMDKLDRETCDIALGPSALLLAIEQTQDKFRFLRREFSFVRLTKIDIYERIIDNDPDLNAKDMDLLLILRVVSYQSKPVMAMLGTTLANITESNNSQPPEFLSLTICRVAKSALKGKSQVEYKCDETELLLEVDYYILTQRRAGSLVGRRLDDSITNQLFDYQRDPFLMPLGIGCWKDYDFANQKRFTIPTLQFSAEYITSNGTSGINYVAYDGYRRLLRLDRDERRSIYDLDRGLSYHANAFDPIREISDSVADASKNCVVLDISDKSLMSSYTMERLMGIGPTSLSATHYMGTKMVDHVAYDVFEAELAYDQILGTSEVPIFMEASAYVVQYNGGGSSASNSMATRYYMTYYLHDDLDTVETVGTFRHDDARTTLGSSMSPKYIELWEVSGLSGSQQVRTLVNRLEFVEFAWSLEVQPESDSNTQDLSHIFFIKSCAQSRSNDWQIRFRVSQQSVGKGPQMSDTETMAFRANKQLIREVFQDELADVLDISRLQVAQLDVSFLQKSANMLADARLVELQAGTSQDKMLGYAPFVDTTVTLKDYIKSFSYNRHSLEACKLDSLAQPGANAFMFCRGLTICVVFQREAMTNYALNLDSVEPMEVIRTDNPTLAKCEVHHFDWAPTSTSKQDSLTTKVGGAIFELIDHPFEVNFRYVEQNQLTRFAKFQGKSHGIKVKKFDSLGLEDSRAPLVGLRFTTIQEDPKARNMNIPIKLTQKREDRFNYCQKACQFDEYCESFSVCVRKKTAPLQASDCILSTLRLSNDRIEPIAQILRKQNNSTGGGEEEDLSIRESDQEKAQVFNFQRDPDCNIHPKDILSSYKVSDTFNATNQFNSKRTTDDRRVKKPAADRVLSLEDCAAESFENARLLNMKDSNFTYCPLNSYCLTNKPLDQISAGVGSEGNLCTLYTRTHTQFYNYRLNTRLSIIVDGETKVDHGNMDKLDIGRAIENLSMEECARDCNLHRSNCLAFDSCYFKDATNLCFLYSIRSPLSHAENKKLGLLPQEKRFHTKEDSVVNETSSMNAATLVGTIKCNHFALRSVYFDIKLQQMLDDKMNVDLPQRDELNKFEDSIINEDQNRGKEAMAKAVEEAAANAADSSVNQTSGGSNFHFLLFVLGLVIGCAAFLKAGGAPVWVLDSWDRFRAKLSSRHQGHRISQLALANSQEI